MAQKIKIQDGIVVYQNADSAIDLDFYINGYLHVSKGITAATLGVTGASTLGPTTISGTTVINAPVTITAPTTINAPVTITAPLTGATGSFSGSLNGSSVTASGTVSGATAVISGSVNATAGIFTGSVTSPIFIGNFSGNVSGNATTASALQTARTISTTGDATWTVTFDGSTNVTNPITLATVNVSPQSDTFRRVTVNGKGLVTATSAVTNSDITTSLGYTPVNKAGDTMSGFLVLNAPPVTALGAVTKQYVDDIASGLTIHAACITSTNGVNLSATYNNGSGGSGATLTGVGAIPSIGGVTPVVGNRILVKDQTTQLQNGIYVVTQATANWILTRTTDFDGSPSTEIQAGDATYVQQGTLAGTQWVQTTSGTITVGVTSIVFSQFGGPGTYTAGTGINIAGTSISNTGVVSNIAGSGISVSGATGNVTIGNTGVLSITGTANQITASAGTGNITLSLPSSVTIGGTMTATTFVGAMTGNATTASALQTARNIAATGDATWSVNFDGSTNVTSALTLSTVNANIGTFNNVTVNAKGLVTAASNVAYITGNQNITLSGDASGSGTTAIGVTLATVNGSPQSDAFRKITVNGKGLVTATSTVTSGDITTALGYTPYNSTNPAGYTTNTGTVTSVSGTGSVNGLTLSGTVTTSGNLTLGGSLSGIANGSLSNSTIQIGSTVISLGSSSASLAGLTTVNASGTITAGTFNATSTKRVKKNIKKLSKTYLAKFAELKPREYNRTDYTAHEFGFIAEEMNEVYPEVVGKDETGRATGIDYGKLSTILTAKVQEQQKVIESLQEQMQELMALVKGTK